MTGFASYVPIANLSEVRALLEEQGFGPDNFSVPLRAGSDAATHAGLHAWGPQSFRDAVAALPAELGVVIEDDDEIVGEGEERQVIRRRPTEAFRTMATRAAIEWSDPTNWFQNPVMKDDQRTHGGKTWRSLIDHNVWTPPIGWREVVSEGVADWVQPTGAHDAYAAGAEVMHNAIRWRSTINANVWEPGVHGWEQME